MGSAMSALTSIRHSVLAAALGVSLVATTGCDTLTDMVISNQQEVELGASVDQQIIEEYKILKDTDPVAVWANDLVQYMVPQSAEFRKPSEIGGYKVKVIYDNDLVNAFAAPGGFVYIVSGLILESANCAEVAGVVGHELAHVTQRHSVKKIAKSSAALGLSDIILNEGLTKDVAEGVYAFLMNTTFSRKDESESDKVGTQIMYNTGYNPYALAHMFENLAELSKGKEPPRFLSSHPLSGDRAVAIRNQIEKSWPGQVDENDNQILNYDCLGTTTGFEDIKQRLRAGTVDVRPDSGLKPPAQ